MLGFVSASAVPELARQPSLPPLGSLPLQPPHSLYRRLPPCPHRLPSNCTSISLSYGARTRQARIPEEVRRKAGALGHHHQRPRRVLRDTGCHSHARPSLRSGRQTSPAQSRAQHTAHPRPHFNATEMPLSHGEKQTCISHSAGQRSQPAWLSHGCGCAAGPCLHTGLPWLPHPSSSPLPALPPPLPLKNGSSLKKKRIARHGPHVPLRDVGGESGCPGLRAHF
jgi:hypothetical protein